jgi:hypothetical protein
VRISNEAATTRFVALTALHWLPNGLAVPVVVLLASARGLSVPEIGAVFIAHGVVVTLLELYSRCGFLEEGVLWDEFFLNDEYVDDVFMAC